MLLFILRHAHAEEGVKRLPDFERRLTDKGRSQARVMGRFIAGLDERPETILTSPLVRAEETARLVAKEMKVGVPITESFLACGMTPEIACEGLYPYLRLHAVLITGHQPDLGVLVAWLLGIVRGGGIEMRKGALCILEMDRLVAGAAVLKFHASPAMLAVVD